MPKTQVLYSGPEGELLTSEQYAIYLDSLVRNALSLGLPAMAKAIASDIARLTKMPDKS